MYNKCGYNVLFSVKYSFDEEGRSRIASSKFWIELIKKYLLQITEFEIRCWADEKEGIEFAKRYGTFIPNDETKEIVYHGKLSKEFAETLIANSFSSKGTMLFFTILLFEGERMILSSSHWGSEVSISKVKPEELEVLTDWAKQYTDIMRMDTFELED